jgi:hypothetical protein
MRIILRIGKGMVHPMHRSVAECAQVVGALKDPGEYKKCLLGKLIHRKSLVGGISMKKEGLEEERKVPVGNKKDDDRGHEVSGFR